MRTRIKEIDGGDHDASAYTLVFGFTYCSVKPRAYSLLHRRQLSRDSMTGSQINCFTEAAKQCSGSGKIFAVGFTFWT